MALAPVPLLPKPDVEEVVLLDMLLLLPVARALKAVVVVVEEAAPVLGKSPAIVCSTLEGSALSR
jgi:hypothetical protein